MSNGTIPEAATYVLGGIVALIVLVGIVLGVVIQVRKIRGDGLAEKAAIAAKAESEKTAIIAKAEAEKAATAAKAEAEVRRIRSEAAIAVEVAKVEASKETASKMAFEQLTLAVTKMDESVNRLSKGVGDQIEGIKKEQEKICRRVDRIADSTRSAHKRMDEHRKVDHSFPNGHYVEPDEEPEPEEEPRL